jgi:hypothetical protein
MLMQMRYAMLSFVWPDPQSEAQFRAFSERNKDFRAWYNYKLQLQTFLARWDACV